MVVYAEINAMQIQGEPGHPRVRFACGACGEESLDLLIGQAICLMAEHVCDEDLDGISIGVAPLGV